jgi:cation diffusion facilitator family transporter
MHSGAIARGQAMNVSSTRMTVIAALIGNLLIAVTKFAAAIWTGSSAMLSEGFHSLVDTSNQVLLLYGQHRAERPADRLHPLGHGRELYFWSFVVAVLIFSLGAGLALYEGVHNVLSPKPSTSPMVNYIVLGLSFLFEGSSWIFAFRNFSRTRGDVSYWDAIRRSKDPPAFIVLMEDSAALVGILIAAAGIGAAEYFERPVFDGVASIGIGVLLAATAIFLARESKSLLIGEAASPEINSAIRRIAGSDPAVEKVTSLMTVHLAPEEIIAILGLDFSDLRTQQIEESIERIQKSIKAESPLVVATFIRPQNA